MRVFATGMPRAGSRSFYSIVSDITERSEKASLQNKSGHGRQHKEWSPEMKGSQVFAIVRDLRDVVVSAYPYIMNHHRQSTSDPKQAKGKHPLYKYLFDKSKENGYNELIEWLLPKCYSYFKSYHNHECSMFVYSYFFFDGMEKRIEEIKTALESDIDAGDLADSYTLQSSPHGREGSVGKWREELTSEQSARILSRYPDFFKFILEKEGVCI